MRASFGGLHGPDPAWSELGTTSDWRGSSGHARHAVTSWAPARDGSHAFARSHPGAIGAGTPFPDRPSREGLGLCGLREMSSESLFPKNTAETTIKRLSTLRKRCADCD
jgi:hypothetical protein